MIYYGIHPQYLAQELQRRNYTSYGRPDELSEALQRLDETGGSEATTVCTVAVTGTYRPVEAVQLLRPKAGSERQIGRVQMEMVKVTRPRMAFGPTFDTRLLVGESITHWTLNTFTPTLHLSYDSHLSCTIDGTALPSAVLGMDDMLRTRLTDISHEEDGRVYDSIIPALTSSPRKRRIDSRIRILEAEMATRTSVAVKQFPLGAPALGPTAMLVHEEHVVLGLRLEGMKGMGYIWARVEREDGVVVGQRTWGDVRAAGLVELEENVALPFFAKGVGRGEGSVVVEKEGRVSGRYWT
ncbi:unnamed protein product [Periconia digitata]|uniref:Uncharacterized protein n=1 Tax=Periconia digitata TaxID=1303443 RepID=A0A9W4U4F4_9PLEO|nr:unnamed protein product [Periconia digitata]